MGTFRGATRETPEERRLIDAPKQIGDDVVGEPAQGSGRTKAGGPGNAGVVALSGNGKRIAVGAPLNDGPPKEGPQNPLLQPDLAHGSVRVYEINDDDEWVQLGEDIDGSPDEHSGFAVALDEKGATLALSGLGPRCSGAGCVDENPGFVRVYEFDGDFGSWAQVGDDLVGDAPGDRFGSALALSDEGDTLAVGVPLSAGRAGHVSVYGRQGSAWRQLGKDVSGEAEDDRAGFALDLNADGRVLAVGARFHSGGAGQFSGHVRVFSFEEDDEWTLLGEDIDGNAPLDKSGRSVALSEDGFRVAIGAIDARNDASARSGHARVFEYSRGAGWRQLGDDVDGLFEGDEAGTAVALSADGNVMAVGSPGAGRGEVRTFAYDGSSNWYQLNEDIEGDKRGDRFGDFISMDDKGRHVAVGSLTAEGGRGVVKVYKIDKPEEETPAPSPKPTPSPSPRPGETPKPSPTPTPKPSAEPTLAPTPSDGAAHVAPALAVLLLAALL